MTMGRVGIFRSACVVAAVLVLVGACPTASGASVAKKGKKGLGLLPVEKNSSHYHHAASARKGHHRVHKKTSKAAQRSETGRHRSAAHPSLHGRLDAEERPTKEGPPPAYLAANAVFNYDGVNCDHEPLMITPTMDEGQIADLQKGLDQADAQGMPGADCVIQRLMEGVTPQHQIKYTVKKCGKIKERSPFDPKAVFKTEFKTMFDAGEIKPSQLPSGDFMERICDPMRYILTKAFNKDWFDLSRVYDDGGDGVLDLRRVKEAGANLDAPEAEWNDRARIFRLILNEGDCSPLKLAERLVGPDNNGRHYLQRDLTVEELTADALATSPALSREATLMRLFNDCREAFVDQAMLFAGNRKKVLGEGPEPQLEWSSMDYSAAGSSQLTSDVDLNLRDTTSPQLAKTLYNKCGGAAAAECEDPRLLAGISQARSMRTARNFNRAHGIIWGHPLDDATGKMVDEPMLLTPVTAPLNIATAEPNVKLQYKEAGDITDTNAYGQDAMSVFVAGWKKPEIQLVDFKEMSNNGALKIEYESRSQEIQQIYNDNVDRLRGTPSEAQLWLTKARAESLANDPKFPFPRQQRAEKHFFAPADEVDPMTGVLELAADNYMSALTKLFQYAPHDALDEFIEGGMQAKYQAGGIPNPDEDDFSKSPQMAKVVEDAFKVTALRRKLINSVERAFFGERAGYPSTSGHYTMENAQSIWDMGDFSASVGKRLAELSEAMPLGIENELHEQEIFVLNRAYEHAMAVNEQFLLNKNINRRHIDSLVAYTLSFSNEPYYALRSIAHTVTLGQMMVPYQLHPLHMLVSAIENYGDVWKAIKHKEKRFNEEYDKLVSSLEKSPFKEWTAECKASAKATWRVEMEMAKLWVATKYYHRSALALFCKADSSHVEGVSCYRPGERDADLGRAEGSVFETSYTRAEGFGLGDNVVSPAALLFEPKILPTAFSSTSAHVEEVPDNTPATGPPPEQSSGPSSPLLEERVHQLEEDLATLEEEPKGLSFGGVKWHSPFASGSQSASTRQLTATVVSSLANFADKARVCFRRPRKATDIEFDGVVPTDQEMVEEEWQDNPLLGGITEEDIELLVGESTPAQSGSSSQPPAYTMIKYDGHAKGEFPATFVSDGLVESAPTTPMRFVEDLVGVMNDYHRTSYDADTEVPPEVAAQQIEEDGYVTATIPGQGDGNGDYTHLFTSNAFDRDFLKMVASPEFKKLEDAKKKLNDYMDASEIFTRFEAAGCENNILIHPKKMNRGKKAFLELILAIVKHVFYYHPESYFESERADVPQTPESLESSKRAKRFAMMRLFYFVVNNLLTQDNFFPKYFGQALRNTAKIALARMLTRPVTATPKTQGGQVGGFEDVHLEDVNLEHSFFMSDIYNTQDEDQKKKLSQFFEYDENDYMQQKMPLYSEAEGGGLNWAKP